MLLLLPVLWQVPANASSGDRFDLQAEEQETETEGQTEAAAGNPYIEGGAYENIRLTLRFGKEREVLTAAELAAWMTEQEDHTLALDEEKLLAYTEKLANKYNSVGIPRTFRTSYGNDITLTKGDYGWELDQEGTAERIRDAACRNGAVSILPVWSRTAAVFSQDGHDIGDSYIEVDLVAQKVWLYKNGSLLLKSDCVSGTLGTDRETPSGVYAIFMKMSPAVLRGADYTSNVSYWMPFFHGYGLHDATWRGSFGGPIFKSNGSHGCVNLPLNVAKEIYNMVDVGYPVVLYH